MTLGEVIETNVIQDITKKLIKNENISNPDISFESGSIVGQGYASVNSVVNINSANKSLSLFLKVAPKDPNLRKRIAARIHFLREIHFYDKVFPALSETCKYSNSDFTIAPKCYDTSSEDCNEYLVLENLRMKGFMVKPNGTLLGKDHALLVFQKLAAFHATSYVLKDQNDEVFQELTQSVPNLWYDLFTRCSLFTNNRESMELLKTFLDPNKDQGLVVILDNLTDKFANMILDLDKNIDKYSALVHADMWINNIMFFYNEQNNPVDVRFVDFQMSMLNAPVLDLAQFFYTCCFTQKQIDNVDFYLDYYYECLSKKIAAMGSDPNVVYPYEIFQLQWKKNCRFGLYMSIGIFKLLIAAENGAAKIIDAMKKNNDNSPLIGDLVMDLNQEKEYAETLIRILRHMVDRKYEL